MPSKKRVKIVNREGVDFKKLILIFLAVLAIVLIFYVFDFLAHSSSPNFGVPSYYFKNKIIYGTLWGLIIYYFIRKLRPINKALIFSAFVSTILQIRYYLEGYQKLFVFEFLFIHFIILLPASWIIFWLLRKKI